MSDRFKSTLQWTLYIIAVLIIGFSIILIGVDVLAPTFFPKVDISGIKEYIGTFSIILSFVSVGLGICSIWQASGSGKQANEILNSVQTIKNEQRLSQDLMRVITGTLNDGKTTEESNVNKKNSWKQDNDVT